MKGLHCDVYESKLIGNCSNHGVSSTHRQVTLVGPGIPEIFEADEKAPAVWLRKRKFGEREYIHAVPEEPGKETVWWMMGGSFIYTCDSRFPSDYPIPLHDRTEDTKTYKILST